MNHFRMPDDPDKLSQSRSPYHSERQFAVIEFILRCLRNERHINCVSANPLRETFRQEHCVGLDSADVWRKTVRIDQYFQSALTLFRLATMWSKASISPWIFSRSDQVSIRRSDASPIRWRSSLFPVAERSTCTSASTSPHGNTKPFSGRTKSGPAPTRSLTATAQPHSIASFTTTPNGSYSDGKTKRSEARYIEGNCDWFMKPRNRTRSATPSFTASRFNSSFNGPSPA